MDAVDGWGGYKLEMDGSVINAVTTPMGQQFELDSLVITRRVIYSFVRIDIEVIGVVREILDPAFDTCFLGVEFFNGRDDIIRVKPKDLARTDTDLGLTLNDILGDIVLGAVEAVGEA